MKKPEKSKRFKYNLGSVLKVREIREKQEQEKFASAERTALEEKRKEEEIKSFETEKYKELRQLIAPGKPIENFYEILQRKSHLEVVKKQAKEQERKSDEADRLKEAQRETLLTAARDKKIMEKDQENKKKAWRKVMDKEETKFLDDISTSRFLRNQQDS